MKCTLPIIILIILNSCGPSAADQAAARRAEQERILDSVTHTPDTLLKLIQAQFLIEDFVGLKSTIQELKARHPDAPEIATADSLAALADQIVIEREQEYKEAFATMRVEKDDMTGTIWYRDKSSPIYVNRSGFYLVFNSLGSLQLKIQYYGEDWLFIDSYVVKADDQTFSLTPSDVERDNGGGDVWEWYTMNVSGSNCEMIKAIANAKEVTVRMNGDQYYKDVTLSKTQRNAFKNTLFAYWGSGGKTCR